MGMIRVLLVEDDKLTQSLLKSYLEKESYEVRVAGDGKEMLQHLDRSDFSLLMLDLGLPDEDGLVLIRQIRSVSQIPIVVITSRTNQTDRIAALQMGADDYLTKPFDPIELLLRMQNIIRRSHGAEPGNSPLSIGNGSMLVLDSRSVTDRNGNTVPLTRAEYDILVALARAPNRVLSRSQLLDATAHFGNAPGDRTIDVLIGRLRRKLSNQDGKDGQIVTVPGSGYMLSFSK